MKNKKIKPKVVSVSFDEVNNMYLLYNDGSVYRWQPNGKFSKTEDGVLPSYGWQQISLPK
jgi:hypothetical protein